MCDPVTPLFSHFVSLIWVANIVPRVMIVKCSKREYLHLRLQAAYVPWSDWAEESQTLRHSLTNKPAAPWLNINTLWSKWGGYICAAFIRHLKARGLSQRNGEPGVENRWAYAKKDAKNHTKREGEDRATQTKRGVVGGNLDKLLFSEHAGRVRQHFHSNKLLINLLQLVQTDSHRQRHTYTR